MVAKQTPSIVFETARLRVRRVHADSPEDALFLHRLWTDPRVMRFVGFPQGFRIALEEVQRKVTAAAEKASEFDCYLIAEEKATARSIGECKLGRPDAEGISETDVKLAPEFWGRKYGVEIKRGLLDYLFTKTAVRAVQATPNRRNLASIRMQEAVGGKRLNEFTYEFPESMREFTTPVHGYVYRVYREDWAGNAR